MGGREGGRGAKEQLAKRRETKCKRRDMLRGISFGVCSVSVGA